MKILLVETELFRADGQIDRQTDRQTEKTKLIGAFRNFEKAPTNEGSHVFCSVKMLRSDKVRVLLKVSDWEIM